MPDTELRTSADVTEVTTAVNVSLPPQEASQWCAEELAERFPGLFGPGVCLPVKLRIQFDILACAPGVFTKKMLSAFLHRHTTRTAYLKALVGATHRIGLDGQPAGEVSDEHRAAAQAELQRRRALTDARRQAHRRQAVMAQRADSRAAQERAHLLRAFEATTLTRKNFCTLRKVSEAQLEAALSQARLERDAASRVSATARLQDEQGRAGRGQPTGRSRLPAGRSAGSRAPSSRSE